MAKVPALELANPAETARNKPIQKDLVLKGFRSFGVFHPMPKYSRVVLARPDAGVKLASDDLAADGG
jgi:hypothetical protein